MFHVILFACVVLCCRRRFRSLGFILWFLVLGVGVFGLGVLVWGSRLEALSSQRSHLLNLC